MGVELIRSEEEQVDLKNEGRKDFIHLEEREERIEE